jgi:hypothetical protein
MKAPRDKMKFPDGSPKQMSIILYSASPGVIIDRAPATVAGVALHVEHSCSDGRTDSDWLQYEYEY